MGDIAIQELNCLVDDPHFEAGKISDVEGEDTRIVEQTDTQTEGHSYKNTAVSVGSVLDQLVGGSTMSTSAPSVDITTNQTSSASQHNICTQGISATTLLSVAVMNDAGTPTNPVYTPACQESEGSTQQREEDDQHPSISLDNDSCPPYPTSVVVRRPPASTSDASELPTTPQEKCSYKKGICHLHGDGAKKYFKFVSIKKKGPDGVMIPGSRKQSYYQCDLGQRGRGKLRQSRISFHRPTQGDEDLQAGYLGISKNSVGQYLGIARSDKKASVVDKKELLDEKYY